MFSLQNHQSYPENGRTSIDCSHFKTFSCSISSFYPDDWNFPVIFYVFPLSRRAGALCGVFTVWCIAMASVRRLRDCKPSGPSGLSEPSNPLEPLEPQEPQEPSEPLGPLLMVALSLSYFSNAIWAPFQKVLSHFHVSRRSIGGCLRWLPCHFCISEKPLGPTFDEYCLTLMFLKSRWLPSHFHISLKLKGHASKTLCTCYKSSNILASVKRVLVG